LKYLELDLDLFLLLGFRQMAIGWLFSTHPEPGSAGRMRIMVGNAEGSSGLPKCCGDTPDIRLEWALRFSLRPQALFSL
jgi:hypothetical protein